MQITPSGQTLGARIEDIDWNNRLFFIPDSKTDNGRRFVPLSDRALELLKARCGELRQGWIFKAFSASGCLASAGTGESVLSLR